MNRLLFVCLVAAISVGVYAQRPPLQKGVSVQMVVTRNASSMPDADKEDAWIITVAADGNLYFGAESMTPNELIEWMKTHPRNRESTLYIKADARAPFASVERALAIGRAMNFETPVLLTTQPEHTAPGTMVPPRGEEVSIGSVLPSGTIATVVQLLPPRQEPPLLINNDQGSMSALEETLVRHFQNGDDRLVLVKADGGLPFSEVMHAIDSCRAAGAKVHLAETGV
jgi:biopolymer transport protein ExbD